MSTYVINNFRRQKFMAVLNGVREVTPLRYWITAKLGATGEVELQLHLMENAGKRPRQVEIPLDHCLPNYALPTGTISLKRNSARNAGEQVSDALTQLLFKRDLTVTIEYENGSHEFSFQVGIGKIGTPQYFATTGGAPAKDLAEFLRPKKLEEA